jgi:hypothetical protein
LEKLAANADVNNISKSLKVYLLLLLSFILFNNAHVNVIDKVLLSYVRTIININDDHVPVFSWAQWC